MQQINHFNNADDATTNIIGLYGQINIAVLRTKCKAFYKAGGIQFEQQAYQYNMMMGERILTKLAPAAHICLLPFHHEYEINDVV
jgi:hypothetical protein